MRKIKFRAWDKVSKIMWEPLTLDDLIGGNWELEDKDKDNSLPQDDYISFAHKYTVWMQYTGLKDKNGKEIYEGDIVDYCGTKYVVAWIEGLHCIGLLPDSGRGYYLPKKYHVIGIGTDSSGGKVISCEIIINLIGNIYENPELLKES
jgi:hypothetical protein